MEKLEEMKHLLIVEDNRAHVRLIREVFKASERSCRLIDVNDGVEAMRYLRREGSYADAQRPDLILLDLNLPKKDGREVLAELKADTTLKRIPVIIITTSAHPDDIDRSYDLHANCYLTKSKNLADLFTLIRRIEEFWLDTVTLASS